MSDLQRNRGNCVLLLNRAPYAEAEIAGDAAHPHLHGKATLTPCRGGTVLLVEVSGLPTEETPCAPNIFAMHLHAGGDCDAGTHTHGMAPFVSAGGHFDTDGCPHPAHAGDLPPLFGNRGYAWLGVYTERFTPEEAVGRTLILHERRDDFTSQPAGDAGNRIACGVIRRVPRVPVETDGV